MTALDRAILRESARIRATAEDCRSRIGHLLALGARMRRDIRRALEREPPRPGEVEIDSGIVAAWAFAVGAVAGLVSVGWAVRWVIGAGSGGDAP